MANSPTPKWDVSFLRIGSLCAASKRSAKDAVCFEGVPQRAGTVPTTGCDRLGLCINQALSNVALLLPGFDEADFQSCGGLS